MDLDKLYEIKNKLILLMKKKKSNNFYLTAEQKLEYSKNNQKIPLRVKGNGRNKTFVKTRGTIESGELKNKKMGL